MRSRFIEVMTEALDADERIAFVLADIGTAVFDENGTADRHPDRFVNVGIREQLAVGVAGGMALEGMRPVVHTYAPFLVERAFEQIKLDLGHQDVGAVLVSIGASYDASTEGRTHHAPGDVALIGTLPDWEIHVPGHADEAEALLRSALAASGRVYIRLSTEANAAPHADGPGLHVVRRGSPDAATVVAVGPTLDATLEATADLDVSVAYTTTVRPFPAADLRHLAAGTDVVLVEPTLAGTSAAVVSAALQDRPHRLLALGVRETELRRYGTVAEHRRAQGLDAAGIRESATRFLAA
jgi:transketolase